MHLFFNKNSQRIRQSLVVLVLAVFLFFPLISLALETGVEYGAIIGLGTTDIRLIIAKIIRAILGLVGLVFLSLILYGGFIWMLSEGLPERIDKAKATLRNAVIGLAIILSAFSLTQFIILRLGEATGVDLTNGVPSATVPGGVLANGIISSHYPARNQREVPRNTMIIVTFTEEINPATIIAIDEDDDSSNNLINSTNIIIAPVDSAEVGQITQITAVTTDNKTFRFQPTSWLGNNADDVWYRVTLAGGITKKNGDYIFGSLGGSYSWDFEVSTEVDLTPPRVVSALPRDDSTDNCYSAVVQITFNEAIDPMSASGRIKVDENQDFLNGFKNIMVQYDYDNDNFKNEYVPGTFLITNQYRTVEFQPDETCGVNNCGETIYCLPGNKEFLATVKAASLYSCSLDADCILDSDYAVCNGDTDIAGFCENSAGINYPQANAVIWPYDGIVDMAANSLDGNSNGNAEGPSLDDYFWTFSTSAKVDKLAPTLENVSPTKDSVDVSVSTPLEALFSELMMHSTYMIPATVELYETSIPWEGDYWLNVSDSNTKTTLIINHADFELDKTYNPRFKSGASGSIKDLCQNCYECAGS